MSANANVWSSKTDVLNDLKAVTGGNTEISDLDDYVAVGARPPPDRRESIDEDEVQYFFGGLGSGVDGSTAPDLDGITQMLQLVNDDDPDDNEPKTIFRNTMTDKISVSKLNPHVTEFVPSSRQAKSKKKTPEKAIYKPPQLDQNKQGSSKISNEIKSLNENKICDVKKEITNTSTTPSHTLNVAKTSATINGLPKRKIEMANSASNSTNTLSKPTVSNTDISLDKKLDISNMKSKEIEEMKLKYKSKITDSKGDSMQQKKEKNVAIAALLRLCTAAPVPEPSVEKPVKLYTPDYFDSSPAIEPDFEVKEKPIAKVPETVTEESYTPAIPTSRVPKAEYKDPFVEESITKVNSWFDNAGSAAPKAKPLPVVPPAPAPVPVPPLQFKEAVTFKKKNTSSLSVNSPKSETSSEKKTQCAAFVPSTYANDLLNKYEKNAKSQKAPKEDWRVTLERECKKKDEEIRKKILEKQNTASPSSGSENYYS